MLCRCQVCRLCSKILRLRLHGLNLVKSNLHARLLLLLNNSLRWLMKNLIARLQQRLLILLMNLVDELGHVSRWNQLSLRVVLVLLVGILIVLIHCARKVYLYYKRGYNLIVNISI